MTNMVNKLVKELLEDVKAPEAVEVIHFVLNGKKQEIKDLNFTGLLFHELLRIDSSFEKLFLENRDEALKQFNEAFSYIQKRYPEMEEEELAFCLCLQNCQEEDFKNCLRYNLMPDSIEQVLSLHNKYHNYLTSKVLDKVLQERTREWFDKIKPDIARLFKKDEKDIKLNPFYYCNYETDKGNEENEIVYKIANSFSIEGIKVDNCDYIYKNYVYDDTWNHGIVDIENGNEDGIIHVTVHEKYLIKEENNQEKKQEQGLYDLNP